MPYYEYRCPDNGRTVEVRHGMQESLSTWGEVAARAGVDPGDTPGRAPVERLMSAPVPVPGSQAASSFQGCGTSCACMPEA